MERNATIALLASALVACAFRFVLLDVVQANLPILKAGLDNTFFRMPLP